MIIPILQMRKSRSEGAKSLAHGQGAGKHQPGENEVCQGTDLIQRGQPPADSCRIEFPNCQECLKM